MVNIPIQLLITDVVDRIRIPNPLNYLAAFCRRIIFTEITLLFWMLYFPIFNLSTTVLNDSIISIKIFPIELFDIYFQRLQVFLFSAPNWRGV